MNQSKRTEIEELRDKLSHLDESLADNDVVMDYRSPYPIMKRGYMSPVWIMPLKSLSSTRCPWTIFSGIPSSGP